MKSLFLARHWVLLVGVFATVFLLSATVRAQTPEARAKGLQKKAMEEDYLATEFDKAIEKLKQAIAGCGDDKCAPQLRANLRRDYGVVLVIGLNQKEKGVQHFIEALKIDSTTALDPDLKTPELQKAFDEARKKMGMKEGVAATASGATPAGDFAHSPVPQQLVRTPVPIYVEYQGQDQLVRVLARYRGFGMTDWKPLELRRVANGWGTLVPCGDVQQGTLVYYIQGFNRDNDPVAVAGDRNNPYRVVIKTGKIDTEVPHLPNEAPPTQCAEKGDCPPGFPCAKGAGPQAGPPLSGGTSASEELKGEGGDCDDGHECQSGVCTEGTCTKPEPKFAKFWFGISGGLDFYNLPSDTDVCKLDDGPKTGGNYYPLNSSGYYCTNVNTGGPSVAGSPYSSGSDFPVRPNGNIGSTQTENGQLNKGDAGKVNGGVAPGNIRVALTFDYAVSGRLMLGGRLGLVLNTYPGVAAKEDGRSLLAPLHLEGRLTYLFKKDALKQKGFAFLALAAVGLSEFDGSVQVPVTITGEPAKRQVLAWSMAGPVFASVGGGFRVAFSPKAALVVAPVKLNLAFGSGPMGFTIQPEAGIQLGF